MKRFATFVLFAFVIVISVSFNSKNEFQDEIYLIEVKDFENPILITYTNIDKFQHIYDIVIEDKILSESKIPKNHNLFIGEKGYVFINSFTFNIQLSGRFKGNIEFANALKYVKIRCNEYLNDSALYDEKKLEKNVISKKIKSKKFLIGLIKVSLFNKIKPMDCALTYEKFSNSYVSFAVPICSEIDSIH